MNNFIQSSAYQIYMQNSTARISNNTITGIRGMNQQKGGIYILGGAPTVDGNFIFHNSQDDYAQSLLGGINLDNATRAIIERNSIIQNEPGIMILIIFVWLQFGLTTF